MLKCRDVAHDASDFIDGRIPWYRRPAWYLHLLICGHCRRFLRHFRTSIQVASAAARRTAAPAEVTEILEVCRRASTDRDPESPA